MELSELAEFNLQQKETETTEEQVQDEINEKLFEALLLIDEKFSALVEGQKTENKRIESAINMMSSNFEHSKNILTTRLNAVSVREEVLLNNLDNIDVCLSQLHKNITKIKKVIKELNLRLKS